MPFRWRRYNATPPWKGNQHTEFRWNSAKWLALILATLTLGKIYPYKLIAFITRQFKNSIFIKIVSVLEMC